MTNKDRELIGFPVLVLPGNYRYIKDLVLLEDDELYSYRTKLLVGLLEKPDCLKIRLRDGKIADRESLTVICWLRRNGYSIVEVE